MQSESSDGSDSIYTNTDDEDDGDNDDASPFNNPLPVVAARPFPAPDIPIGHDGQDDISVHDFPVQETFDPADDQSSVSSSPPSFDPSVGMGAPVENVTKNAGVEEVLQEEIIPDSDHTEVRNPQEFTGVGEPIVTESD